MIVALYRSPTLLLALTAWMWAMNAMFGQLAVGEIAPMTLVLARWVVVSAIMWPLFGRQALAVLPAVRARLGLIIFMSITGFTAFNAIFYVASIHTSGVNIGILQGSMPVMVLIGAFLVYRERVTALQAVGVAITLVGVVVVAAKGSLDAILGLAFGYGDVLMLIAAVFYSAYTVAIRNRPPMQGEVLFTVFAVFAAICALPLFAWEVAQPGYAWPSAEGWLLALAVAIFPSCLAQLFFLRGVDLIGPGRAGVYINLVPIFAAILAVFVLGEVFALYHALALGLVFAGIWFAQKGAARSA